jgi:hypothetical protein
MLLHGLSRVERVEVTFGTEIRTWYLNVTKAISDSLMEIEEEFLIRKIISFGKAFLSKKRFICKHAINIYPQWKGQYVSTSKDRYRRKIMPMT